MKKFLTILIIFIGICYINPILFTFEGEPIRVEPPKEYATPKTEQEAKQKLEEAVQSSQEAEKDVAKKDAMLKAAVTKIDEMDEQNIAKNSEKYIEADALAKKGSD